MAENLFDDLIPGFGELNAFVATHVLRWEDVCWQEALNVYVGRRPGEAVEVPVPQLTECEALVETVIEALRQMGHEVLTAPVPEGWRVQVGNAAVTSRTLPLALCASTWRALR